MKSKMRSIIFGAKVKGIKPEENIVEVDITHADQAISFSPKNPAHLVQAELAKGSHLSIIQLINHLVEAGQYMSASDIHLDPEDSQVKVRFRIDGVLHDLFEIPKKSHDEIISRIKILAALRTDEHQAAQDGRFQIAIQNGQRIDVRVSIIPVYYGENAVLRLLSDKAEDFTLDALGFTKENQAQILNAIHRPYGMILITGPTGSGKTTTLYSLIKILNTRKRSIITIEDPIEYSILGVNQIQANAKTELTFANGLRSILRQDPNIIMVGEIRDAETAGLAVNTSLTGHLLLSTLHTNDAATTLPRLLDMKVEAYLIASTVNIAIAQRLIRRICSQCKVLKKLSPAELKSLEELIPKDILGKDKTFYSGKGCEDCGGTGYKGRIGVHEVLVVDNAIREAILNRASASDIRRIATAQGMRSMAEDGFEKAVEGLTTVEEVLRMQHE